MISTAFSEVCLNMHITLYIKNYEYIYLHCSKLLLCIGIGLVNYILQEMVIEKKGRNSLQLFHTMMEGTFGPGCSVNGALVGCTSLSTSYVTVFDKTRHMGFFMKFAITSLLVLMTSELTTVRILERSLASFFSYDAFYLDHFGNFIISINYGLNVLLSTRTAFPYTTCIRTRIARAMCALRNNQLITIST